MLEGRFYLSCAGTGGQLSDGQGQSNVHLLGLLPGYHILATFPQAGEGRAMEEDVPSSLWILPPMPPKDHEAQEHCDAPPPRETVAGPVKSCR